MANGYTILLVCKTLHDKPTSQAGSDPGFWFGGRSSAEGARIEAPQASNRGGVWGGGVPLAVPPPQKKISILGSRNAYFGAFFGPST